MSPVTNSPSWVRWNLALKKMNRWRARRRVSATGLGRLGKDAFFHCSILHCGETNRADQVAHAATPSLRTTFSRSSAIRCGAFGSAKVAVPTSTALAPAIRNSAASRVRDSSQTDHWDLDSARCLVYIRRAIGLIAGPDKPPKPAPIRGVLVSMSMASEINVFTSEIASAPDSSAARANG